MKLPNHPLGHSAPNSKETAGEKGPTPLNPAEIPAMLAQGNRTPFEKFYLRYFYDLGRSSSAEEDYDKTREPRCRAHLQRLDGEGRDGIINGLRELAFLAHASTQMLRDWSTHDPSILAVVAQSYTTWPVLMSMSTAKGEDRDYLRSIRLDAARTRVVPGNKVVEFRSDAQKWAHRLILDIEGVRRLHCVLEHSPGVPYNRLDYHISTLIQKDTVEWKSVTLMCGQLPEPSAQSCSAWWKVALRIFDLLTNKRPFDCEDLKQYVRTKRVKDDFDGRKADGVKRNEIVKQVRQAFYRLVKSCGEQEPKVRKMKL
jgi:hypothetical protein